MIACSVSVRFGFDNSQTVLVSAGITQHYHTPPHVIKYPLPFGSGVTYRRFFPSLKSAKQYVRFLRSVYSGRINPHPPLSGGQLPLF